MLNDVLCNTVVYTNICVHPFCVLKNESVSECYTGATKGLSCHGPAEIHPQNPLQINFLCSVP